jgi:putative transcriptional regulator
MTPTMTHTENTLLDDGLMLDVASGRAPAAVRVLAACQVELNGEALVRLDTVEAALGGLLDAAEPAEVSSTLYQRTLAALDDPSPPATVAYNAWPEMPRALRKALPDPHRKAWRRKIGGVREIVLHRLCEDGVHVRLLSIPSGAAAPEHAHGGDEITLVLSGSFSDEGGRYGAGDVCHADAGDIHRPVVDSEGDCLCLAIEFGAMKPTNPFISAATAVLGRIF